jgi:hypothetical protein
MLIVFKKYKNKVKNFCIACQTKPKASLWNSRLGHGLFFVYDL